MKTLTMLITEANYPVAVALLPPYDAVRPPCDLYDKYVAINLPVSMAGEYGDTIGFRNVLMSEEELESRFVNLPGKENVVHADFSSVVFKSRDEDPEGPRMNVISSRALRRR